MYFRVAMRLSVFRENDNVLLVGEGNFSFAASLVDHNLKISITASCYESSATNEITRKNLEILENHGIRVLLGVDATKLGDDTILGGEIFDKIIFNFPHVGGKMRIERNRELLRKFFVSAERSLKIDGEILMTLCNGQGGTLADDPRRRWDDSWKVTEMAAHGNFILTSIEPFKESNLRHYVSTGYRGLDKEFNMEKSLTHFFRRSQAPCSNDFAPSNQIDSSNLVQEINRYQDIFLDRYTCLESLCPPVFIFDITFSITPDFRASNLYEIVYNFAGRIVREVEFVRCYKFPNKDKVTETYRISYQSDVVPLHRERIVEIHKNFIPKILEDNLHVIVTR